MLRVAAPASATEALAALGDPTVTATFGHGWEVAELPADLDPATVSVAPAPTTAPRLLVSDVDSTVILDEAIELLADRAGTRAEVAAVTERAMRGELDFAASLAERVATLAGLPVSVFADVAQAVRPTPGLTELLASATAGNCPVVLVSGGFHEILAHLTPGWGIPPQNVHANRLEVVDGRLTGRTRGPVIDRQAKADHLRTHAAALGVTARQAVAVGDGANDLAMIDAAGLGLAFCAKPVVAAAADGHISHRRLDVVAWLSGLPLPAEDNE